MEQPRVEKITNYATGKHYVKYKCEYIGPYTNMSDCDRAYDVLTIKLAVDRGYNLSDGSLANIKTVYPVDSYFKTDEGIEVARRTPLTIFIKDLQKSAVSINNQAVQGQRRQVEVQAPSRPISGPTSYESLPETEIKEEEEEEDSENEDLEDMECSSRPASSEGLSEEEESSDEEEEEDKGPKKRSYRWTQKEIDALERQLVSMLGIRWYYKRDFGHADLFRKLTEKLKGLGYRRGFNGVRGKALWLKKMREEGAAAAATRSAGQKQKRQQVSDNSGKPHTYHWSEEETQVLKRELVSTLGESWSDKISFGAGRGVPSGGYHVYEQISDVLKELGYHRSANSISIKVRRLKETTERAELGYVVPQRQMQQQRQQGQDRGGSIPAATVDTAVDDGISSPASTAALAPAPAPPPPPTTAAMLEDIEKLLQHTPGLSLSEQDVCAFMAECVRDAETRAWNYRTLVRLSREGKPEMVKEYVKRVLK